MTRKQSDSEQKQSKKILPGAYQLSKYLPLLKNKKIAIVGNQTSEINYTHLVDTLLTLKVNIVKVFAPEHGFRGKASAGEQVKNSTDIKTGLPIISLYGKHKKPTTEDLQDIDILLFDIQDVGARFYTYLSTLHYIMEAAAEQNKKVIVLDRPNPNSDYIDGPVMQDANKSFVGLHPVPVVYAMTIGEYAQMINGENWLKNAVKADLTIIKISNYKHGDKYELPVKPSPNLPNYQAVRLYPSLCLFEGTDISCGRGTDFQFQVYGSPNLPKSDISFVPRPNEGSKWPKHEGKKCYGTDLRNITPPTEFHIEWLIDAYQNFNNKETFFNQFFIKLAGDTNLQTQIIAGTTIDKIRLSWQKDLNVFKQVRRKYLLYQQ
jgi:uncharacterized protein YbbC (DUF1343 family)